MKFTTSLLAFFILTGCTSIPNDIYPPVASGGSDYGELINESVMRDIYALSKPQEPVTEPVETIQTEAPNP